VPLDAATLTRVEALVKEAVGFDAARGDSVSVMNAPFVREPVPAEDVSFWESPWLQNPMVRDVARYGLGAIVVLALLFGVLRPAMRQIIQPRAKKAAPDAVDVSLVDEGDEDARIVAALRQDRAEISVPRALASDAYEDRLRHAREAVKNDSKQVAQVVKDWVASDD